MKQHTIIVVPHARARFRKWRFTTLQLALVAGAFLLLTVGSTFALFSYFTQTVDREALAEIEAENADLRQVNQGFEQSIGRLQDQLADYQQRIHKLAIVAGLAELSPSTDAGIGGLELPGSRLEERRGEEIPEDLRLLTQGLRELSTGMDVLELKLEERDLMISSTPAIAPAKGLMTSGFGFRRDPFTKRRAFHSGLDIVAPVGQEVHATGDGIVTHAGRLKGLGISVYLSHGHGITTRYGHLSRMAVRPGAKVKRGDVIGYVGNTGRSTGYHLHYEVRIGGKATDPRAYILDGVRP